MSGSLTRTFKFMFQMLASIKDNKSLLSPLILNLIVGSVAMIAFSVGIALIGPETQTGIYLTLGAATLILYFIDYFFNGMTVSMFFDQYTKGNANLGDALRRTMRALPGIMTFAAITTAFEMLQHAAAENKNVIAQAVLGILKSLWTTATYVILPAMVINGLSFGEAFKRSKQLAENQLTQVGIGYVGMGIVTMGISSAALGAASFCFTRIGGMAGLVLGFLSINLFWALSGYLKTTYYTCFYIWAAQCKRAGKSGPELAPAPLREAITGQPMYA